MYFEGGVSSVYLWDLDHGFAGERCCTPSHTPMVHIMVRCLFETEIMSHDNSQKLIKLDDPKQSPEWMSVSPGVILILVPRRDPDQEGW